MKHGKSGLRVRRMLLICTILVMLMCAASAVTFAATDGATANPYEVLKVFINGVEAGDGQVVKNEDGSIRIELQEGEDVFITEKGEDVYISHYMYAGELKDFGFDVDAELNDGELAIDIIEDGGETEE